MFVICDQLHLLQAGRQYPRCACKETSYTDQFVINPLSIAGQRTGGVSSTKEAATEDLLATEMDVECYVGVRGSNRPN